MVMPVLVRMLVRGPVLVAMGVTMVACFAVGENPAVRVIMRLMRPAASGHAERRFTSHRGRGRCRLVDAADRHRHSSCGYGHRCACRASVGQLGVQLLDGLST